MNTNADFIRSMNNEQLKDFIISIVNDENPWDRSFYETFCRNCPVVGKAECDNEVDEYYECDFNECPHGSEVVWWLQQPVENLE